MLCAELFIKKDLDLWGMKHPNVLNPGWVRGRSLLAGAFCLQPIAEEAPVMAAFGSIEELGSARRPTSLWDPAKGLSGNLMHILESVSAVMEDSAIHLPSSQASNSASSSQPALLQPLVLRAKSKESWSKKGSVEHTIAACMFIDRAKVKQTSHMSQAKPKKRGAGNEDPDDTSGYLHLTLGYRVGASAIKEDAHRLVLLATKGPPPAGMLSPYAMHSCGHKGCLNPEHIGWGTPRENRQDIEQAKAGRKAETLHKRQRRG